MPRAKHYDDVHMDMAITLVMQEGYSAARAGKHVARVAGLSGPIPAGSVRSALKRRRDVGEPVATAGPVATPEAETVATPEPVATPPDPIPPPRPSLTVPVEALSDPRVDPQRLKAAIVLAQGGTHEAAAEAAGVARSTVTTWMQDPVLQTVVGDLKAQVNRALWEQGATQLLQGAVEGIGTLRRSTRFLDQVIARGMEALQVDLEGLDPSERKVAEALRDGDLDRALAATRAVPTNARPMMDAGGFPKTERIEHAGQLSESAPDAPEVIEARVVEAEQDAATAAAELEKARREREALEAELAELDGLG